MGKQGLLLLLLLGGASRVKKTWSGQVHGNLAEQNGIRPIGRPKNRWEDDVRKDLQTMKIKTWKRSVLDRDLWKKIVERTKTHNEL